MDETVKDLDVGAEKSDVQDQNLVHQNSGQRLSKAMLDDYSSGNQMLSLIPQTGEFSRQSISMCIGSSASRSKSPRLENKQQVTTNLVVQSNGSKDIVCTNPFEALGVEKELELIDSNPSKEKTLVRTDPHNNIQSVSTPIGVCSMWTDKYGNVMSPTVAKAIQESQAAMLLKPNSAIKPPMVTLSILAHEKIESTTLEFVPKSTTAKKNEQEALASGFSLINAYASDLADDSFDEGEDEDEDEDEDDDEDMLDICFDKVARDGDISPRHQRSGSNKNKKEDTWKTTQLRW
uniref:NB-ARC domain containing protein n=1 Tax=Solanum tuberosum TaxID=4113 RepID=M0ZWT0_SOLTU